MTVTSHNMREKLGDDIHYLSHIGLEVDEKVWLTPEGAIKGEDPVVGSAIDWIQSLSHAHNIDVVYPLNSPGNDTIAITALVENPNDHAISVSGLIALHDGKVVDSIQFFRTTLHKTTLKI